MRRNPPQEDCPALPFNLPHYPLPTQFSDPYNDWAGNPNPYGVSGKSPSELSAHTLWSLFNDYLPAGTFEEMAPYIPRVLELLLQEPPGEDGFQADLLETFIIWCHVEQKAIVQNPPFLAGLQEAVRELFRRRTAEANPLYAEHVEHLLKRGDYISFTAWPPPVPWLSSEHFLPHLQALDSVPHAAWLLHAADEEAAWRSCYPSLLLEPALRHAAMDMVEDWLLTSATRDDIAYWDPIVTRAHEYFQRHPYTP